MSVRPRLSLNLDLASDNVGSAKLDGRHYLQFYVGNSDTVIGSREMASLFLTRKCIDISLMGSTDEYYAECVATTCSYGIVALLGTMSPGLCKYPFVPALSCTYIGIIPVIFRGGTSLSVLTTREDPPHPKF